MGVMVASVLEDCTHELEFLGQRYSKADGQIRTSVDMDK